MVQYIDYYIDDNETIYVHVAEDSATVNDVQGFNITFDMSMLSELSGQSTVFLNHARFSMNGRNSSADSTANCVVYNVAGIVPEGTITGFGNGFSSLEDYQQVKGWPLKGCFGTATRGRGRDSTVDATLWQGVGQSVVWTRSYKPRSSLLLSRLQVLTLNCGLSPQAGFTSGDWKGTISMDLQLKRGN